MRITSARTNCAPSAQPTLPERDDKSEDRVLAQRHGNEEREEQLRDAGDRVRPEHHERVGVAATPPREHTEEDREERTQQQREEHHGERESRAPQDPRELVAPERIGPERVVLIRRRGRHLERAVRIEEDEPLRLGIGRAQLRAEQRDRAERDHASQASDQRDIAQHPAGVVAPHRALTFTARVASATSPPMHASATAKTSAIADANATLPVATERMNA
jgi:hypothetical protein